MAKMAESPDYVMRKVFELGRNTQYRCPIPEAAWVDSKVPRHHRAIDEQLLIWCHCHHPRWLRSMNTQRTGGIWHWPGRSRVTSPPCGSSRTTDRALEPGREPPLGAHMVTPRRGYTHHGIYIGEGKVVQYAGLSWGLRRGPIEEVSLAQFARGRPLWIRLTGSHWYDAHEVLRRARSRLGEDHYSVLTNNCEHFCEWCIRGEHRSYQVDQLTANYGGILRRLVRKVKAI